MKRQYQALAEYYDELNGDIDYSSWCDFICEAFDKYGVKKNGIVLDLACGTGNMSLELAARGYEVIGIDLSCEMLGEAARKTREAGKNILYLEQDMCSLDLYGTVDAAVCCLDGINYLADTANLRRCFSSVNKFMNDGGLFIFDVNTPRKFKEVYGNNAYILEGEDVFCAWQNDFNQKSGKCEFFLTFFVKQGNGTYTKSEEVQCERCYSDRTLRKCLTDCSFEVLGVYGDTGFGEYKQDDDRWYYVCRAKNNNKTE